MDVPARRVRETTTITVHGVDLKVQSHWVGSGELERVTRGLEAVQPQHLEDVEIEFTNRRIRSSRRESGFANGLYHPTEGLVELSRAAARDWSDRANKQNRKLALKTLWHEIAHHVWFRDFEAKGDQNLKLRRLWATALDADKIAVPGLERTERFAELFAEYMEDPETFVDSHPNVGAFYRDNLAHPNHVGRIRQP